MFSKRDCQEKFESIKGVNVMIFLLFEKLLKVSILPTSYEKLD